MTESHITDIAAAMQDCARLNARVAELEGHVRALLPLAAAGGWSPPEFEQGDIEAIEAARTALQGPQS